MIPLDNIDRSDDECRISYKCDYPELEKSIRANGIINPIIIYPAGGKYKIISGFKLADIAAVASFNCKTSVIGCLVAFDIPPAERLLMNIYENASIRQLNPAEICEALKKLSAFYDKTSIIENYLPVMNIQKSEYIFNKYLGLGQLSKGLKTLLVHEKLPAAAAFIAAGFSGAAQEAFLNIIKESRMGANLIVETARLIFETAMQYGKTEEEILNDINYTALIENKNLTANQKTETIRAALNCLKRPMYESYLQRFNKLSAPFAASKISINPFAYFEKDEITVKFNITSAAELEKKIEALKRLKESKLISEFLKEGRPQ